MARAALMFAMSWKSSLPRARFHTILSLQTFTLFRTMKKLLLLITFSALPLLVSAQTVADSQRKAAAKYPELSKAGSPLNIKFIAMVNEAKQNNPTSLNDPNWPMILADRAAGTASPLKVVLPKNIPELQAMADKDYAPAQAALGVMHRDGQGFTKDDVEAVKWFRKAAELGDVGSIYNLAVALRDGAGVDKDADECVKFFNKAAEAGDAKAQFALGVIYEEGHLQPVNDEEAAKWFRKTAELGIAEAQSKLAMMYFTGRGVKKDGIEGVKWLRKVAENGDMKAQCDLGIIFRDGQLVTKNETEAVKWVRKAAEQGDPRAQYALADMYQNGLGVPKNVEDAYVWMLIAGGQGNDDAQTNISRFERHTLTPAQRADGQRKANEFKPKKTAPPPDGAQPR